MNYSAAHEYSKGDIIEFGGNRYKVTDVVVHGETATVSYQGLINRAQRRGNKQSNEKYYLQFAKRMAK